MGREQMRNLEISKIGATQVNEFEFHKHQGEMTEQEHAGKQGGSGGKRLTQAERIAQVTAAAHKKVEKKRKKEAGSTKRKTAAKKK
jgi:hypothetical protein